MNKEVTYLVDNIIMYTENSFIKRYGELLHQDTFNKCLYDFILEEVTKEVASKFSTENIKISDFYYANSPHLFQVKCI